MPSMTKVNCKCCGKEFEARTADVKRGWGKFCSKKCKAIKQTQKIGYRKRYKDNYDYDDYLDELHPFSEEAVQGEV